jgi:hypothetical protein
MKKIFKLSVLIILTQLAPLYAQTSGPGDNDPAITDRIPAHNSQNKLIQPGSWELSAALNPGITFRYTRVVIGADLQAERYISNDFALTLSAGFTHITNKTGTATYTFAGHPPVSLNYSTDQNLIPVKIGIKVFPADKLYLLGAAGIGIDINGNSSFAWSATAGQKLGSRFDLGLKYENYTDFSVSNQLAVRLGYRIF